MKKLSMLATTLLAGFSFAFAITAFAKQAPDSNFTYHVSLSSYVVGDSTRITNVSDTLRNNQSDDYFSSLTQGRSLSLGQSQADGYYVKQIEGQNNLFFNLASAASGQMCAVTLNTNHLAMTAAGACVHADASGCKAGDSFYIKPAGNSSGGGADTFYLNMYNCKPPANVG